MTRKSLSAIEVAAAFSLSGDITPPQITADTHNWNPTGLSGASVIRLYTDVARNLTGIAGGSDGRVLVLLCGSGSLILKASDAGSSGGNQFLLPGDADITLTRQSSITLIYDSASTVWRPIAIDRGSSSKPIDGSWSTW